MSEADTPNNPPLSEPTNSMNASDTELRQTDETEWIALTKKLRQRNRTLLKQVAQLEQALAECQESFQSAIARSQGQEALLLQQTEELNASQEQATRLFNELESSHQAAQRQQNLIETLSQQLETSQQRIAQMEREGALTQQQYKEQSHKLLQTENVCQELQTRLQRQQRQTLQFKTALEKCLEVPVPSYEPKAQPTISGLSQRHLKNVLAAQSLLSKTQPIQPWSAQPDLFADSDDIEPSSRNPVPPQSPSPQPLEAMAAGQILNQAEIETSESRTEPSVSQQEVDQQLLDDEPELARVYELLSELGADLPLNPASGGVNDYAYNPDLNQDINGGFPLQEDFQQEEADENGSEWEESSVDSQEDIANPEPTQRQQPLLNQPNWPSPVVYPLRPPKKLKSLAAIDLPSFPPYRPS